MLADPHGTAADSEAVRQAGTLHVVILAVDTGAAPALAAAGGVWMAVAGLLVLVRGWRWGALGERYQLPATGLPATGAPEPGATETGAVRTREPAGVAGRAEAPAGQERVGAGATRGREAGTEADGAGAGSGGERTPKARSGVGARGPAGVDTDAWRAIEEGEDPTQEP